MFLARNKGGVFSFCFLLVTTCIFLLFYPWRSPVMGIDNHWTLYTEYLNCLERVYSQDKALGVVGLDGHSMFRIYFGGKKYTSCRLHKYFRIYMQTEYIMHIYLYYYINIWWIFLCHKYGYIRFFSEIIACNWLNIFCLFVINRFYGISQKYFVTKLCKL